MPLEPSDPLTPAAESALVLCAQRGDETATSDLVASQLRFIITEARRRAAANSAEVDDLTSAGIEAMLGAIRTFDPSRGTRLITHCIPEVRAAMNAALADHSPWAIKVPGRTLRKYRRAMRANEDLEAARESAGRVDGMDPETFDAVHSAVSGGVSLFASSADDTYRHGGGAEEEAFGSAATKSLDMLGAKGPAPEGTAIARALARQGLAAVTARQRAIVRLAYLDEGLSDPEIAERLGMSRPTVTRDRNNALAVMRDLLA